MKYIVYLTLNIVNNKIYIGVHKTKDPEIFDGYIGCGVVVTSPSSYMHPTTPFLAAVKKYGTKNFRRSVLKSFDTIEEAYNLEAQLVTHEFLNRKDVYNSKLGGLGGSSAYIKIFQYSLEGKLIKQWESIQQASDFYLISHSSILRAEKDKGSCLGFYWSRESSIDIKEYTNQTKTQCFMYNEDGKYLDTYLSITEACKANNLIQLNLQRAIKGGYKIDNKYFSTTLYDEYKGVGKVSFKNKPIYIYNLQGTFITELISKEDIYLFFNIKSLSEIRTALRCSTEYKGYQLSLVKEEFLLPYTSKRNIKKLVELYDLFGNLINTFDSISQAKEKYGSGVLAVLRGLLKQCKNYIFRYKS